MDKGEFFAEVLLREVLAGQRMPLKGKTLWLALHTADPGPGGVQGDNELRYAGYARAQMRREPDAWKIAGTLAVLARDVVFPMCTGGEGGWVTHATLGLAQEGAGGVLWRLHARMPIEVLPGVRPVVPAGSLEVIED